MFGTIFNAAAIIIGATLGLLFNKNISKSVESGLHKALGIAIIIVGLNGVIGNMFTVSDGKFKSNGELLLVVSLAIGTLIGELLKLDDKVNKFGDKIQSKFKTDGFTAGFVSASSIFCIGAMAIIGSLNSGISGDHSVLITKSFLDFTVSIVLAANLGAGVLFSFIPVTLYQGSITLLAGFLHPYLTPVLLSEICMIGYVLIMCIGLNFIITNKIKTVNLLPSILIPVFYHLILYIF